MTSTKQGVLALSLLLAAGCQGTSSSDGGASAGGAGSPVARADRRRATPQPLVLEAGTPLTLELRTALSTASSRPGDLAMAVVREDVSEHGRVVIPAGSELRGRVTTAVRGGKTKGNARLAFAFDEIEVRGHSHPLSASAIDISAKDSHKKDAAILGGGTAGGALVGAVADGKKGAGIGALLGAAAGGAVVLTTRGEDVSLPSGTALRVHLAEPLRL
jgi:hypothetical protein